MPIGPGKYDSLCTYIRTQTNCKAALVIVMDGDKGSGFSMQSNRTLNMSTVADILETVAKQIREGARG